MEKGTCYISGETWTLDQERDHDAANEITDITETTGPSWVTPDYDARGNMVISPKPGAETTQLDITYDAWNRQTKVVDHSSGNTLGEYRYDGLNRRIRKFTDKSGDNWTVREFYYNFSWQSLEERKDVRERTGATVFLGNRNFCRAGRLCVPEARD